MIYLNPKTREIVSYVLTFIGGVLGTIALIHFGEWYVDYLRHIL